MKGITAPPRMMQLWPVDTARSTVKPHPRNRTVSANPCSVFTNMPLTTLSHKRAHLCWRKSALPMTLSVRFGTANRCAPPTVSRDAATTREGRMRSHARRDKHTARNQTVDAPSVHQQNARWKTPVHAHGASNHTMDTTGTCHPQKLR